MYIVGVCSPIPIRSPKLVKKWLLSTEPWQGMTPKQTKKHKNWFWGNSKSCQVTSDMIFCGSVFFHNYWILILSSWHLLYYTVLCLSLSEWNIKIISSVLSYTSVRIIVNLKVCETRELLTHPSFHPSLVVEWWSANIWETVIYRFSFSIDLAVSQMVISPVGEGTSDVIN